MSGVRTATGGTHEPCTVMLFKTASEDALLRRVRGEYREMPGMRLTIEQAMRLWNARSADLRGGAQLPRRVALPRDRRLRPISKGPQRVLRPSERWRVMRKVTVMFTAIAAVAVAGCATMNVSSHIERGINFADYVTYDWGPPDNLPVGDPRLDNNPFFNDYLQGAIEKKMAAKGYERAVAGGADLLDSLSRQRQPEDRRLRRRPSLRLLLRQLRAAGLRLRTGHARHRPRRHATPTRSSGAAGRRTA